MTSILEESERTRSKRLLGFSRNKKIIIPLIAAALAVVGYFFWPSQAARKDISVAPKEWTVKRDNIVVAVQADGKVVAEDGVELSFSLADDNLEVKNIYVKEGDQIRKGDKIASVSTDSLQLSVQSAWSSYQSALADYNEAIGGPSEEAVQAAKDKIENAQISLKQGEISLADTRQAAAEAIYNAEQDLKAAKENWDKNRDINTSESVRSAYDDLLDAVRSTSISLESILPDSDKIIGVDDKYLNDSFEVYLGAIDQATLSAAQGSYIGAKSKKEALDAFVIWLSKNSLYDDLDKAADMAAQALAGAAAHLYDMQKMLNASVTSSELTQSELDAFKSTVNTNRGSVNTKITGLDAKIKAVETAKDDLPDFADSYNDAVRNLENAKADSARNIANSEASLDAKKMAADQAQRDYDDLFKPMTAAESASAKSRLTAASVSLRRAQNDLDKATIISPIDGQVVQLNYKGGDIIVDKTKAVAVILNPNTLYINVDAEEGDVSKLRVGQKAMAAFDALDNLELEGEVSFISLTSETSNNGIVTYAVRVLINNTGDQKIREGMTASMDFISKEVDDVLVVPVAAVRNVQGSPSVQMKDGAWMPVVTGFTDGKTVEVISGVKEGDVIVY